MPKQQDSNTLSLPQLLQLAGIGGQPQQDTTREALSYMMGQQRLAADDADRKVRQSQNEEENRYRMKALDAQLNQKDNTAALHALGLLYANTMDPTERARIGAHISSLTGMPAMPAAVPEKTYENDPKVQPGYKAPNTGGPMTADAAGRATAEAVPAVLGAVAKVPISVLDFIGGYAGVATVDERLKAERQYWDTINLITPGTPRYKAQQEAIAAAQLQNQLESTLGLRPH